MFERIALGQRSLVEIPVLFSPWNLWIVGVAPLRAMIIVPSRPRSRRGPGWAPKTLEPKGQQAIN